MYRLFISIVAWLSLTLAWAGPTDPNDIRVVQNNPNIPSNGTLTRYVAFPGGGASCLLVLDGSTTLPACAAIGSGISYSGGTLTASGAAQVNADWTANSGAAQILNKPTLFDGAYASLSGIPSTFTPSAHNQAWSTITSTPTTLDGYGITDGVRSITAGTGLSGGTITGTGTISLPNTGTASTYSGVTTDAQGRVTAGTVRSFAYQTRALNTCFQVSASRDAFVTYAVDISASLSLSGGTVGTVYLRTYTNNTCSAGAQEITRFVNGNTGALTVGLNTTQNATGTLTGIIPAGLWVQQVTENTTGSPTFQARPGQEVLL